MHSSTCVSSECVLTHLLQLVCMLVTMAPTATETVTERKKRVAAEKEPQKRGCPPEAMLPDEGTSNPNLTDELSLVI